MHACKVVRSTTLVLLRKTLGKALDQALRACMVTLTLLKRRLVKIEDFKRVVSVSMLGSFKG